MAIAGLLVKAVNKPTRPEMVPLRYAPLFETLVEFPTSRHEKKTSRSQSRPVYNVELNTTTTVV